MNYQSANPKILKHLLNLGEYDTNSASSINESLPFMRSNSLISAHELRLYSHHLSLVVTQSVDRPYAIINLQGVFRVLAVRKLTSKKLLSLRL